MSMPYRHEYGAGPLGSQSQSSSTVSFKTDINRQKTRRWVEAKSVSYDGDDWGDDDTVEEEAAPSATAPTASSDNRLAAISEDREPAAGDGTVSQSRDDTSARTAGSEQTGGSTEPSAVGRPADGPKSPQEEASDTIASKTTSVEQDGRQESSPAPSSSNAPTQASEIVASPQEEGKSLQRDPSLGFRSVVHQAFESQDPPTATSDEITRSDSVSTSVISPIIPHGGLEIDKTKTIEEHPDEAGEERPPPGFQPGHRRDLSLPGSENDERKHATVVDGQQPPEPQLAQTVTVPPTQSQEGQVTATSTDKPTQAHDQQPVQNLAGTTGSQPQPPMPLQIPEGQSHSALESAPPSVGTEASPQETESDRLRREIIRSLSPDPQQASHPAPGALNESHTSPHLPSDGEHGISPPDPLRIKTPVPTVPQIPPADVAPVPSESGPASEDTRPKLAKRFSWEESSNETGAVESAGQDGAAPTTGALPEQSIDVPASREGTDSRGSEAAPRPPVEATPAQSQAEPPLRTFKQIMEIKSPEEKIRAFKETREQFAAMDTGLSEWLRRSSESLQDHADLVQLNGEVPGGAPARALPQRSKFPKLASLGNLSLSAPSLPSTSQASSSQGHARRPSAPLAGKINMQNVESKGKDLLHSAGMLGGKAGDAARGLFAKGKSKFRSTTDKGSSKFNRRSLQCFKPKSTKSEFGDQADMERSESLSNESKFSSQPIPRLPSFKFKDGRNFLDDLDLPDVPSLQDARDKLSIVPERHSDSMGSMTSWLDISPTGDTASNLSRPYSANDSHSANIGASEEGRWDPAAMLRLDSTSSRATRPSTQALEQDITRSTSVSASVANFEPDSLSLKPGNSESAPAVKTQQDGGSASDERGDSEIPVPTAEPPASVKESHANPEPLEISPAAQQGSGSNEIEQRDSQGSEPEIARSGSISAPHANDERNSPSPKPSNSTPAPVAATEENGGSARTPSQESETPQPEASSSVPVEPSRGNPESASSSPDASHPVPVSVAATQQDSGSAQSNQQSSQASEREVPPSEPATKSHENPELPSQSNPSSSASGPAALAAQVQPAQIDAQGSKDPKSEDAPSAPVETSRNENPEPSSSPDASGTTSAPVDGENQDNGSSETKQQEPQASEPENSPSGSGANSKPAPTSTAAATASTSSAGAQQNNGSTQADPQDSQIPEPEGSSSVTASAPQANSEPASASPDDSAPNPGPGDFTRQDSGAEHENTQASEQESSSSGPQNSSSAPEESNGKDSEPAHTERESSQESERETSSQPQSTAPTPAEATHQNSASSQAERVNSQGNEQGVSSSSRPSSSSPAPTDAAQQNSGAALAEGENSQTSEQETSSSRPQSFTPGHQRVSGSHTKRESTQALGQEASPSSRPSSTGPVRPQERESTHSEGEKNTQATESGTPPSSRPNSTPAPVRVPQRNSGSSQAEQPNSQAREREPQPSAPVATAQANTRLAAAQDRQNLATASDQKPANAPDTPQTTQIPRSRTAPSRRPDLAKSMSKPLPSLPPLAEQLVVPRPWADDPLRDNASTSTKKSRSQKPTTEVRAGREKSSKTDPSSSTEKTKKPTKSTSKPARDSKDSKSSEKQRGEKEQRKERSSRTKESLRIPDDTLRISQMSIDPEKNEPLTARPVTVEPPRPIRVITLTRAAKNRDKESRKSRESNASIKNVTTEKPVATSKSEQSVAGEPQSPSLPSPKKVQSQKPTGDETPSGSPRLPQTEETGQKREEKAERIEKAKNEHGDGVKNTSGAPSAGTESREKPPVSQVSANSSAVDLQHPVQTPSQPSCGTEPSHVPGQPQRSDTLVALPQAQTGSQVSLDRGCLSRANTCQDSAHIISPMNSFSDLKPLRYAAAENHGQCNSGTESSKAPASEAKSGDKSVRNSSQSVSVAASGAESKSKVAPSERAVEAENPAKSTVPFPNRFKFLGLRSKTVSEINAQMGSKSQGQSKPDKTTAKEPTQKKFIGSKKGTLSRFSGWFHRSGSSTRSNEKRETQYTTTWAVQPSQPPVDVGLSYRFSQLSYAPYLHTLGSDPRGHNRPGQTNEPKPEDSYKKYDDPSSFDAIRPSSQMSYSTKEPIFYSPQQVLEIHRSRSVGSPQVSAAPTSTGTPRTSSPDEQERGRSRAPDNRQRSRSPLPEPVPDQDQTDDSKADAADTDKSKARMSVIAADLREKMPVEEDTGPRSKDDPQSPVELPVPGDDWSEKIEMTSTAYPGQEWHPDGFEHWSPY